MHLEYAFSRASGWLYVSLFENIWRGRQAIATNIKILKRATIGNPLHSLADIRINNSIEQLIIPYIV
jgi:hypothetical protein